MCREVGVASPRSTCIPPKRCAPVVGCALGLPVRVCWPRVQGGLVPLRLNRVELVGCVRGLKMAACVYNKRLKWLTSGTHVCMGAECSPLLTAPPPPLQVAATVLVAPHKTRLGAWHAVPAHTCGAGTALEEAPLEVSSFQQQPAVVC